MIDGLPENDKELAEAWLLAQLFPATWQEKLNYFMGDKDICKKCGVIRWLDAEGMHMATKTTDLSELCIQCKMGYDEVKYGSFRYPEDMPFTLHLGSAVHI